MHIRKAHTPESKISGNNCFCHSKDKESSGSSKKIATCFDLVRNSLENKDMICFSPDERVSIKTA